MATPRNRAKLDELGNVELLRLVADDELPAFAQALGLDGTRAGRDDLERELARFDAAAIVDAILASKAGSLEMLGDIFRAAERCGAKIRTTGGAMVLPTRDGPVTHTFSKHAVGLAVHFSTNWRAPTHAGALNALGSLVDSQLLPWVRTVRNQGYIREHYRPSRANTALFDRRTHVDHGIRKAVQAFTPLLREAHDKVVGALGYGPGLPAPLDRIEIALTQLNDLESQWRRGGFGETNPHRHEPRAARHAYARAILQRHQGLFAVLHALTRLADVAEPDAIADLIQLSLLKDRPRIFEVWVMMQLIGAHQDRGAAVKLEAIDVATDTWMLNFARSSSPVAKIVLSDDSYDLFYQRLESSSMPDIRLVKASTCETAWVVDPKYSEKAGYSLSSYVETARRYSKAFDAQHSIVAEFFPRLDLDKPNPWEIAPQVFLVRDVRPRGTGHAWLLHTLVTSVAPIDVLAIDVSSSHLGDAQRRASAADRIRQRVLLLFGDEVETFLENDLLAALAARTPTPMSRVEPLVAHLEALHASGCRIHEIEVWSDFAFDDGDLASLEARVEALGARLESVRAS